jgi:uncharacterized membrane protein
MEGLLAAYIIYYLLFLIPISIIYYKCLRNIFLKKNEIKTVISLVITFVTLFMTGFLKVFLDEEYEPLYFQVLVILIALIIYLIRKIKIYNQNNLNKK